MPELKPLDWPPITVETEASEDQLQAMIQRVAVNFEHMGETEPYWSVLSADEYRLGNVDIEKFYQSGNVPVRLFEKSAERCGVPLRKEQTCLELGCGLGRSTVWLADLFGHVTGADLSEPHLAYANEAARRLGKTNTSFFRVTGPDSILDLPDFDAFFSVIVLQHNPPPVIARILENVLSRLRLNGLAYFQVPTYRRYYSFKAAEYLASEVKLGTPEMHVLPQPALYDLFERSSCQVLEVRENEAAGAGEIISNVFLLRKGGKTATHAGFPMHLRF